MNSGAVATVRLATAADAAFLVADMIGQFRTELAVGDDETWQVHILADRPRKQLEADVTQFLRSWSRYTQRNGVSIAFRNGHAADPPSAASEK